MAQNGPLSSEDVERRVDDLRKFLNDLNVGNDGWKVKVEEYFKRELLNGRTSRIATFSVGDDAEDEINDYVAYSLSAQADHKIINTEDKQVQCDGSAAPLVITEEKDVNVPKLAAAWKDEAPISAGDALLLLNKGIAKTRELEKRFGAEDAIAIRRAFVSPKTPLKGLPYTGYDYSYVMNSCCENVIGLTPIPVGVAGPLIIKGGTGDRTVFVPMATTEGALIASTNRGCSAISASNGVSAMVTDDKMTRAPVVKFRSMKHAVDFKNWVECRDNFKRIMEEFQSTSNFAKLQRIDVKLNGNMAFVRFVARTGDAMGMNMVSKASDHVMTYLKSVFPSMEVIALSGNYCVDKKASALNWIEGRGRSVVADCVLSADVVRRILRTTPKEMEKAAQAKLGVGSDMAACMGGSNAHAANIVAAIFLATGQDAAQVITSSMCSTRMEVNDDGDLYVSCTLPCVEVGTVGGGTILRPQNECLKLLNCAGPHSSVPGANARALAEVIASTVLAGELSLMAALCTENLVSSHMKLNRSKLNLYASPVSTAPSVPVPTIPSDVNESRLDVSMHQNRLYKKCNKTACSNIL